jgi:hypothetical protein
MPWFENAVRVFAEIGMDPERTVPHLVSAGFPVDLIRARFPQVPDSAFTPPAAATVRTKPAQRGAPQLPNAHTLAERVLRRAAPSTAAPLPRAPPPAPASPLARLTDALAEGVSFQYVPLIQCSFPHADPGDQTHFTRRNGWLELTLSTARPDTGLPYGVPARLLTMFCASEAVRTRSPEIFLGATVHDFLRRLDVPITRGERGSLRAYANQLLRLVHCAVSIDENIRDAAGRTGLHIRQALFVEEARLWWDTAAGQGTVAGIGHGSSLILSPVLYDSILERSAPLSTAAIRQLRKSPMDLDVYAWLAHRLFHLSKPSTVTWPQLSGQFGHSYTLLRKFRTYFAESIRRVSVVYPEANVKLTDAGVILLPSRPHIPRDALADR